MSATIALSSVTLQVNYNELKKLIRDFFTHFKSSTDVDLDVEPELQELGIKYMDLMQKIANRDISTLYIALDDIKLYQENQFLSSQPSQLGLMDLVAQILKNTHHFTELFASVVDEMMPEPTKDISYKDDVLDVILHQRKLRNLKVQQDNADELNQLNAGFSQQNNTDWQDSQDNDLMRENTFPAKLTRRYHLYFKPLTGRTKALAVRDVKGPHVGKMITVRGIVTRVSDVKPSVLVNAYTCDKCGYEIFQEVNSKVFQPLVDCTSPQCKNDNQRGQLYMLTRASKFLSFQEVKIQEMASQVPVGHIPRTLTIHVNGDLVRLMNPGDIVDVSGIFLPSPYTGFRALKAGLLTETYLEAQFVQQHKKQYESLDITPQVREQMVALNREGNGTIYRRLAQSIAPEIFGHLDVKKILLLLLCGGVTKEIGDGMRIRGDINVCLMGDPGVAKSQLLKAINKIAPRSVYTTGRGSSGVGLTAAVMRDPVTDEMVLEGGALVLADNGICCIDEFDKMEEGDRTAIHEVMEQQTISISKAGINTTLNARTSILAAANPLYGRYNPRLSPHENINLPAALLSRFDIMFLMLDQASEDNDEQLAEHVTYVHREGKQPEMDFTPLDPHTIRQYISVARTFRPVVPKEVGDHVVQLYIRMRKEAQRNENSSKKFVHITPRTLLGILRISQALARIRFDNVVRTTDVDEALRLLLVSKSSMDSREDIERDDITSRIMNIIRGYATQEGNNAEHPINMIELHTRLSGMGYTQEQIDSCIQEYSHLGLLQIVDGGESLLIIDQAME